MDEEYLVNHAPKKPQKPGTIKKITVNKLAKVEKITEEPGTKKANSHIWLWSLLIIVILAVVNILIVI